MLDNFKKIPAIEQKRILDASIEEFALHGYEQASTNSIVKKAGIPKGTLFYYFGNKKKLYLYVLDLAILRYMEGMRDLYVDQPDDIFERLLFIGQVRMQFVLREPLLYRFFFDAFVHAPVGIRDEIQSRYPTYAAISQETLLKGLDISKFKQGVDINKAHQLILSVMEGIFNRYLPVLTTTNPEDSLQLVDSIFLEVKESFELLKSGLYY